MTSTNESVRMKELAQLLKPVSERLSAWADNASLMLRQAHNNISEERWQNERDNYTKLAATVDVVIRELRDESSQEPRGECRFCGELYFDWEAHKSLCPSAPPLAYE